MHRSLIVLTTAALGVAAPALAQKPAAPVAADSKAGKRALLDENVVTVRNVSRAEIVHGLPLVDDDGVAIGAVERLAGNDVIVSDGTAEYRIPFTRVYAFSKDGADHYASRTPKARLKPEPISAPPAPPPPPPAAEALPPMDGEADMAQGPEGGEPMIEDEQGPEGGEPAMEDDVAADTTADAVTDEAMDAVAEAAPEPVVASGN